MSISTIRSAAAGRSALPPEPPRPAGAGPPRALPDLYVPMDRMPRDSFAAKDGFRSLPPLLKGYLRLGGYIGDGAIIDPHCNAVDVCIIVQTDLVADKYSQRYSPNFS